jgi:FAD/FMN-containing dehydrogenase
MGRAEDIWAIRHHVSESLRNEGKVLAFDISVPRSRLAAFSEAARALLVAEYPFVRCCDFGHWGDGGTHLNLVWNEETAPRPATELVSELQARIYDLAVKGVGPHNQRFYEAYTPPSARALTRAIKTHLDPREMLGTTRL